MAVLALSPSAGVLWYCPPVILAAAGLRYARAWHRRALMTAVGAFVMFISSMTIFKGDPAWGPRYLTPIFAALWLYAPEGWTRFPRRLSLALLAAGVLVQLLALTVDPHRLYVERSLPSAFGAVAPVLYFDPRNAHLANRSREIVEIWEARHDHPAESRPHLHRLLRFRCSISYRGAGRNPPLQDIEYVPSVVGQPDLPAACGAPRQPR